MPLTLTDIEDFIAILPLEKAKCSIDSDDFIEKQYKRFLDATADAAINQYMVHKQLRKFCDLVSRQQHRTTAQKLRPQKLFLRRNFLFNLVYHKYAYDMQSIRNQNIFNNYYFDSKENNLVKQLFIAFIQIALTGLLLMETANEMLDGEIEWDNPLNLISSIFVVYLTAFLIEPQMTSCWDDFLILKRYFRMRTLNVAANFIANIVLALLIPLITFFVIMTSESVMDIVLNATAITFIIELDDIICNEVDVENWFVNTSSAAILRLFKETIAFNDDIVVNDMSSDDDIHDKVQQVREHVQAFNDVPLCWSWNERLGNLIKLIAEPIYMWRFPFMIAYFCCRVEKKSSPKERDSDYDFPAQSRPRVRGFGRIGHRPYGTFESVQSNEEDEDDHGTVVTVTDPLVLKRERKAARRRMKEARQKKLEEAEQAHQMSKALRLNNRGNEEIVLYQFDAACKSYEEALSVAPNNSAFLSVVSHNAAFALYERGKRSFTSEIVTCWNGHPYTNYMEAEERAKAALSNLNETDEERKDECRLLLCKIYIALYRFDDALTQLSLRNSRGIEHKKLAQQIAAESNKQELRQILAESTPEEKYLQILDELRQSVAHLFTQALKQQFGTAALERGSENFIYTEFFREHGDPNRPDIELTSLLNDTMIDEVNATIDGRNEWLDENALLKGKFFFMRSEYFLAKGYFLTRLFWSTDSDSDVQHPNRQVEEEKDKKDEQEDQEEEEEKRNIFNNSLELEDLQEKLEQCSANARRDAIEAKKCSDLYGWLLLNLPDLYDTESSLVESLCRETINAYTTQIEFDGNQPYYYYVRGRANYKLYSITVDHFDEGIDPRSQNDDRGDKNKQQQQDLMHILQRAADNFKCALDLDPTQDVFWLRFGLCQYRLDEQDAAAETFKQAQRLGAGLERAIDLNKISTLLSLVCDRVSWIHSDQGVSKKEWYRIVDKCRFHLFTAAEFKKLPGDDGVITAPVINSVIEKIGAKPADWNRYWTKHLKDWELIFNQTKHGDDELAAELMHWRKHQVDMHMKRFEGYLRGLIRTLYEEAQGLRQDGGDSPKKLTKDEYEIMVDWMPNLENMKSYFEKLCFETYAGGDGLLYLNGLCKMIDEFVEEIF